MELKTYQATVLDDLDLFLDHLAKATSASEAFRTYWTEKQVRVGPGPKSLRPYQDILSGVPTVCLKVPTAGGKTFLGLHAVHRYFAKQDSLLPKVVAWLVPSLTILDQTLQNFRNPDHPYRRKWDALFQGRVQILTKDEALSGTGFNPEAVRTQLVVVILSFDSFRTQNKEGRKVYQENSALSPFASSMPLAKAIPQADPSSLAQVINTLRPLVVVDESHNAGSELSTDMLNNLNPSFVLELTATPRPASNIVSFVDSLALKAEHMVKLPVVVYNSHDANEVIHNALALRRNLEAMAAEELHSGGAAIRPIILFQAEPQGTDVAVTFKKLKGRLVEFGVPVEQIAIKTADINELKNIKLEDPDCPIRFIITINALKEGWDCPFAYILATLANRSSPVDVEQILGRVLRQPYVRPHKNPLLNLSYVLTGSADFLGALGKIVSGLNKAGFSKNDYRISQAMPAASPPAVVRKEPAVADRDFLDGILPPNLGQATNTAIAVEAIQALAVQSNQQMDQAVEAYNLHPEAVIPTDLQGVQDLQSIKPVFRSQAEALQIPQFFEDSDAGLFNTPGETFQLVGKQSLMKGFKLSNQNALILMEGASPEAYKVDVVSFEVGQSSPEYMKLEKRELDAFVQHLSTLDEDQQRQEVMAKAWPQISRFEFLSEKDTKAYVTRVVSGLEPDQLEAIKQNPWAFGGRIKIKIQQLADLHAEAQFKKGLDSNLITCRPHWKLSETIHPLETTGGIPKSLYPEEETPNGFELKVINEVANTDSVLFWHRNIDRKEFVLNGWLNHYPDFIIVTKRGTLILLETKGDDRDNSDSEQKLRLGKYWESKCGTMFKYFMVFDQNPLAGAHRIEEFLEVLKHL